MAAPPFPRPGGLLGLSLAAGVTIMAAMVPLAGAWSKGFYHCPNLRPCAACPAYGNYSGLVSGGLQPHASLTSPASRATLLNPEASTALVPFRSCCSSCSSAPSCSFWTWYQSAKGGDKGICSLFSRDQCSNASALAQFPKFRVYSAISIYSSQRCGKPPGPDYLAMSDNQLWNLTTYGNKIGSCYISISTSYGPYCDLYVSAQGKGWPTKASGGTGCVKTPDFPKRQTWCFFQDPAYELPAAVVNDMCTSSGKHNAVAQIRYALEKNVCFT